MCVCLFVCLFVCERVREVLKFEALGLRVIMVGGDDIR